MNLPSTIIKHPIFLFLLFLAKLCAGQLSEPPNKNVFFIQPQVGVGKIINNMPEMPDRTLSVYGDVNLAWQTRGKQIWNQYYKYPQVGVLFSAAYLGNNDILGHSISVVPNLIIRLSNWRKLNVHLLMGLGFSYFTKTYDEIDNRENRLIGSRITNRSLVAVEMNYQLSKKFILTTGVSASHYSGGHYQLPNFGINMPAVNIGIKYFPSSFPEEFYKYDSLITYKKNLLFSIKFGIGYHEFGTAVKPTGGPKYPIYTASAYLNKRVRPLMNLQFGINYNYYSGYYDFIENQEFYSSNKHLKASSIIGFVGMEFMIGKFGFTGKLGAYLYNEFYKDLQDLRSISKTWRYYVARYITTRLGVQYYIFKPLHSIKLNPWIGAFLKSNGGAADFAEICIGCAF